MSASTTPTTGATIPPQDKTFTTVDLVAYGAATWDWHRLHYDVEYARSVKLPNVIVDGQQFGSVFAKALMDWLGPRAFVRKMSMRFKSMVFAGDAIRCEGEVTDVRTEGAFAIVICAQRLRVGEKIAAEATSEVRVPAK